jgi:hypothetical protein
MKNNCKTKNALILLYALLVTVPLYASSGDGGQKEYCALLKEKLSVNLTVSSTLFESLPETVTYASMKFGDYHLAGGCPIFLMGPAVKLDKHCSIVLMDMKEFWKPSYHNRKDYTWPVSTAFMLNNCSSPWAYWYIYNIRGVRFDDYVEPSPEELRDRKARADSLRNEYERRVDDGMLLKKTNCDRVFIIKIPNLDKIEMEAFDALKSGATECYAVEFYKHSAYGALQMIFFINGNETSIDECVAGMAGYIRFE